jgi:ubiquinone/menaquinone biosynthesis C-methylase UbiE
MTDETPGHWFEAMAEHLGPAYLRYSFTKGTEQEVDFLVEALQLTPGQRVLDVGCGPGRHAHALAQRGIEVHGVDISAPFIELAQRDAPPGATFEVGDARKLAFDGTFDAVISLCQGGFGLVGDEDPVVLEGMARAVKPEGLVVCSAFSAYFAVRFIEETDTFDAATGVNHERSVLKSEAGEEKEFDLWTSCFTPRELRLLCERAGLEVRDLWSVTPGAYRRDPPDLDHPEWLVVARRAGGKLSSR